MLKRSLFVLIVLVLSLSAVSAVLAVAPATGEVIEGQSVPGISLGDTRAAVEAAYGAPSSCQSVEAPSDFAYCAFDVEEGGRVWVRYRGPDGGNAVNSAGDIVHNIRWYDVAGWTTTAGINTTLATANRQAVADTYPNANVTYNNIYDPKSSISSVFDPELGIEVSWHYDVYGGFTVVSMAIYSPYTPSPPPDTVRVAEIVMSAGRRSVTAEVLVLDQQDRPVQGALVEATWFYPKDRTRPVSGLTGSDGVITFTFNKAGRGTYYLNIDGLSLDGYVYDRINSTTLGVYLKNK